MSDQDHSDEQADIPDGIYMTALSAVQGPMLETLRGLYHPDFRAMGPVPPQITADVIVVEILDGEQCVRLHLRRHEAEMVAPLGMDPVTGKVLVTARERTFTAVLYAEDELAAQNFVIQKLEPDLRKARLAPGSN